MLYILSDDDMIYTYRCQRPRPRLKIGVENSIIWSSSNFGEPSGTPPPRTSRSIYNLNSSVVLFSDLLILFYLTQNELAQFLPTQSVARIKYLFRVLYCPFPSFLFLLQLLHFHIYYSCSNINISISTVFVTTPVLPSLLVGSVPTPALPFLLFLLTRQLFRFYYLCFHTCSSIFTVSAPTLALSFLLCQLPHLHFHLCCFCSYSCTDFSTASVASLALSFFLFRVSTVREKSGKTKNVSRSGKSQATF